MILKGNQRAGACDLATHLLNAADNEHIEIAQITGAIADDLHGAFSECPSSGYLRLQSA